MTPSAPEHASSSRGEVFILGAGFSKAISPGMPLTCELSKEVLHRYSRREAISDEVCEMIEEDLEKALTFLAQHKPWLPESENLRHKALYLDLTHIIRGILHEKCRAPQVWGTNAPPGWLEALITHWHRHQCYVLTLNYDTLIERVASASYWKHRPDPIPTGHLYPLPLTPAADRGESPGRESGKAAYPNKTFRLLKLHGSINWFYSGRSEFFGEEIYYIPCVGGVDGTFDALEGRDPESPHWTNIGDKTALIIPPVLDKGAYFQHESLRSLWFQASQAIRSARRIICMGYSLPDSDLTMAQFLKTSAPSPQIPFEIVDVIGREQHFAGILGANSYKLHQGKTGEHAIPEFVVEHVADCEEPITGPSFSQRGKLSPQA